MKYRVFGSALLVCLLFGMQNASAESLSDISNYRDYTATFSSSGQPDAAQLELLKSAGFEQVIYLAFTTSHI